MKTNCMKTYCRACMQVNFEGAVNLNYSELADGKTLFVYFNECTQLQADSSDELPQILCRGCAQRLQDAYNFVKKAKQSDRKMKKILTEQKTQHKLLSSTNGQQEHVVEFQNDPLLVPDLQQYLMECDSEHEVTVSDMISEIKVEDHMKESNDCDSEIDLTVSETTSERKDEYHMKEDNEDGIHDHDDENFSTLKDNSESSVKLDCERNDFIVDDNSEYSMPGVEEELDIGNSRNRVIYTGCSLCDYKYTTQDKLKEHIFQMHKSHILCLECPKVYEFPDELQLHEYLVHATESPMQCNWCRKTFNREELPKHFQKRHRDAYTKYFPRINLRSKNSSDTSKFSCDYCQKSFPSIHELADHMKDCKFNCPICLKGFKKLCTYRAHLRRIHNRTLRSLKKQLKSGQTQQEIILREHMESDNNPYINKGANVACPYCRKRFKHRTSLYNHKTQEHGNMITTEGNSTIDDENIDGSKIKYPDNSNRKFLCSFCPRDFSSEMSVISHEKKIHLGERPEPEPCPICKKKFDPIYLKKHIQCVHTSERKFICDVCGVYFKSYLLMYSHKLLHFERNFQCTVCEKKFIRSSDLKVHMRMHTGEEPYACHICDQRFKMKVRLTYHLKRHAGIKRKCNVCGKEFNHIKQLKIHSYKHTGMPYRCTLCHYACAQRDHFRKHLRRMHNMTMTNEEYNEMFRANTGRNSHVKTLEELKSEEQSFERELQSEAQSNKHEETN